VDETTIKISASQPAKEITSNLSVCERIQFYLFRLIAKSNRDILGSSPDLFNALAVEERFRLIPQADRSDTTSMEKALFIALRGTAICRLLIDPPLGSY
jgi:hypothetical protein